MSSLEIINTFGLITKLASEDNNVTLLKPRIDHCLNFLKEDYKEIISKSFLNKDYEYWWLDIYSDATYYRKRSRAIGAFLNLFIFIYGQNSTFTNLNTLYC